MTIFIPHTHFPVKDRRLLFILTRPFFFENQWLNDAEVKAKWGLHEDDFELVASIDLAKFVIIPFSINSYFIQNIAHELTSLNEDCKKHNIKAYGFVVDDFGIAFQDYSNIIYLRANGFKSQLSSQNKGFPIALSDHFQKLFGKENITPNQKKELPRIGFCGHANSSFLKRIKELLIFGRENAKRFLKNPIRNDWEPLFSSAFQRSQLLKKMADSSLLETNFIYRDQYRAGAKNKADLEKTTLEYFENIYHSDYVLCIRGAGNYSVRFYETLMMGRIPIFVNTDCLLPFEDIIDWNKHVVFVEWKDRNAIASIVSDFHSKLSNQEFIAIQLNNRKLWKETLSTRSILQILSNDI